MLNVNVFAVDPGVTTGWAYVKDADLTTIPQSECDLNVLAGQMMGDENQQAIDLYKLIVYAWPVCVVIEDFVPQMMNQARHFLSPVRITSKLELLLFQGDKRHIKQMPVTAKSTIRDDYMRSAGLWQPGQPHANDAIRHALVLLRRIEDNPVMAEHMVEPLGISID
jgi:hypothetical protein